MNLVKITIGIFAAILSTISVHASKHVVVDLTHQVAVAYQDGEAKFFGRISTGKAGRRTPTGSFRILEKETMHVSNLWPAPNGGAKMPYMMRLTRDGIAMHLGPTPNHPASHGCIRLKSGFAQRMFAWADRGMSVKVIGIPPAKSPKVALYENLQAADIKQAPRTYLSALQVMSGRYSITNSTTTKNKTKTNHKSRSKTRANPLSVLSGRHIIKTKIKKKTTHRRHKPRKRVNPLLATRAR